MEAGKETSRLVLVVPLKEGMHNRARELLAEGPPFDLEAATLARHDVYVTRNEVVFVFESLEGAALKLPGEDLALWRAANEWRKLMAGRPRKAETAFSWQHSTN
jgi:hypothetical protein